MHKISINLTVTITKYTEKKPIENIDKQTLWSFDKVSPTKVQ